MHCAIDVDVDDIRMILKEQRLTSYFKAISDVIIHVM